MESASDDTLGQGHRGKGGMMKSAVDDPRRPPLASMGTAITITEVLGTIHDGTVEVCATAAAEYDPAAEKVSVTLDAFARHLPLSRNGRHFIEEWMPRDELVSEHLPREHANAFTRDIFQTWVRKVRASVPQDLALKP
jgi:hypothetical protein